MWKRLAKNLMSPCSPVRAYLLTTTLLITFILFGNATQQAIAQTPTPVAEQESVPARDASSGDANSGDSGYDASAVPMPNGVPSALQGEALYLENCAPCHGQDGNSDGPVVGDLPNPPPLFSDPATIQLKSPAEYFHTTKFGRIENLMPPWGNRLSDDDIWHAAAYAWTLHTSEEETMAGLAILEEATADDPSLLDSIESSFANSTFLFWTQTEIQDELALIAPELTAGLSTIDLANVSDYLRTLTIIPPWGATYRAGNAAIEGALLAQTDSSDESLGGLPVTLTAYIQFEPVASFETTTDDDGRFEFEGLSGLPSVLYLLETTFSGVNYGSDVVDLAQMGEEAALNIEIPVYETTEDSDSLTYNRVNWVVDYAPGELIVGQILSIGNEGDRTVVGRMVDGLEQPVTVELLLPTGANTVQFQDGILGGRYWQLGDIVYDTMPVIPGEGTHQVFMSYRLPVEDEAIQLEQEFRYPIQTLNLLVADIPGIEADAAGLTFVGAESVQNIPYLYWQGQNLEPQTFPLALSGVLAEGEVDPRGDLAASGTSTESAAGPGTRSLARTSPVMEPVIPIAVGGILFFLLAGIVVWPLSRLRGTAHAARLQQDKARLTKEIALLDDRQEAGDMDEDEWQESRRRLKEQLLSITRQIQNSSM